MMFPAAHPRRHHRAGRRPRRRKLYRRAGLGPGEMDVAQIYDCFTISVILQLEAYGFCAKGEGGPFAASGRASSSAGALPINTGGGHLSEGYIHGMNHIVQGVRQLRGTPSSQVPGAETCLVTVGSPLRRAAPSSCGVPHDVIPSTYRDARNSPNAVLGGGPSRRARRAGA